MSLTVDCMQDTFARARTRPSVPATIGYLVYKTVESITSSLQSITDTLKAARFEAATVFVCKIPLLARR